MKILVVQESDWIKRNPHQQHHLMERLSVEGHEVKVIDYPIDWDDKGIYQKREVVDGYHKIYPEASIQVIRPSILKLPLLVYPSLVLSPQERDKTSDERVQTRRYRWIRDREHLPCLKNSQKRGNTLHILLDRCSPQIDP